MTAEVRCEACDVCIRLKWAGDRLLEVANGLLVQVDRGAHLDVGWLCEDHKILLNKEMVPYRSVGQDACRVCHGTRGGVPGNENIIDGVIMCDYCHADRMGEPHPDSVMGRLATAKKCFWDKTTPFQPGDGYETVSMSMLESEDRLVEGNTRFRTEPDWVYEPEPRDGTFYPITKGTRGEVHDVRVAGLRMYSSWKRPAKEKKMGNDENFLITVFYEKQESLLKCALQVSGLLAAEFDLEYPMEAKARAWLHAQLPLHVRSCGPIVQVDRIFAISLAPAPVVAG